jgi:hypothetical protein
LGAALLARVLELGWAARVKGSRVVAFTAAGERAFQGWIGVEDTRLGEVRRSGAIDGRMNEPRNGGTIEEISV